MAFWRRKKESRAITEVPWNVGGPSTPAVTQDRALTLAPVFAACRYLGDHISTLPLQPYRRIGDRREKQTTLPQLFRFLTEDGVLNDWLFEAVASLALRGNSVGIITEWDGFAFPIGVRWVPMDEIYVDDSAFPRAVWYWRGVRIDRSEIVHVPWFKVPGRTLGLSPIEAYALTITSGLEAQRFGTDWFLAGGVPPGTFKNSAKTVNQTEADVIKARLVAAIRAHKPIVYGSDWEYNAVTIPPEQAQFIETMKLSANQIAAIYGIEPEEIGGEAGNSLTYMNEEHRQIRRMADLRPWLERFEAKFASWLPERQYVKFNIDAPVRIDLKTRHEVYRLDREIGLRNIDECRALDDLPPLPDGQGKDYTPLRQSTPAPSESPTPLPAPSSNGNHALQPGRT